MYRSPVSALLIRHPRLGNILYDTGNSPYSRWEYGEAINSVYPVGSFVSIEQALSLHGLKCSDIDMIILSHLHFDHVEACATSRHESHQKRHRGRNRAAKRLFQRVHG